jgi:recombination protein RecA
VETDSLLISQPDYGEQALEIAENLISSGGVDVVVVDSVAALTPLKELEGEMGDSAIGLQARMMSQAMRKLVATVNKHGVLLIFINQWREKIGVMFGDARVPTGGNALKFYASVRLEVSRSTTEANSVNEGEEKIGNLTKVKVLKNKVAPPFRTCEFNIMYGKGIWKEEELLNVGVDKKVITKAGSHYSYKEVKLGQGKAACCQLLAENPELFNEIRMEILK